MSIGMRQLCFPAFASPFKKDRKNRCQVSVFAQLLAIAQQNNK
jgi:hypothetical protein